MVRFNRIRCMLTIACLSLTYSIAAQTKTLEIGDTLPDLEIQVARTMEETSSTELFSLAGKPTIFDFWSVWCASCIKALPALDSLQAQFGDSIQVVSVTKNSREEVQNVLKRFGFWPKHIKIIYSDTIINQLFPHVSVPFHVWVDQHSIVRHITGSYNATKQHIAGFVAGKPLRLSQERDNDSIGFGIPLGIPVRSAIFPFVKSYSMFLRGMEEQTRKNGIFLAPLEADSSRMVLQFFKQPLYSILSMAYSVDLFGYQGKYFSLRPNPQIILETRDSSLFFFPEDPNMIDGWGKRFLISYEAILSTSNQAELLLKLRSDLATELPYSVSLVKRKMKVWVVGANKEVFSRLTDQRNSTQTPSDTTEEYWIRNTTLEASIIQVLRASKQYYPYPIVDETGIKDAVTFYLGCSPFAPIRQLQHCLAKHGLTLSLEERTINVLEISDKRL